MTIACSALPALPEGVEAVGVPAFSGLELDPGAGVDIDRYFCSAMGFSGQPGQCLAMPSGSGSTVVLVGMGDQAKVTTDALRRAGASLVRTAWPSSSAAFVLPGALPGGLGAGAGAQAVVEGALMAAYQFMAHKSSSNGDGRVKRGPCVLASLAVVGDQSEGAGRAQPGRAEGVARGSVVARAVCLARDLVNQPAGAMTPRRLAEVAERVGAETGLSVTVWDENDIAREGLGGLAGVAQGSAEPARMIRLDYQPAAGPAGAGPAARTGVPTVALVGKGITFDSGGLSIKPADGMMTMKTDMSGAAAVLGACSALGALGVGVKVVAFLPTTENMPGGRAIKPGDVLTARNGKTIEVLNTDAEGRLVLADGLSLAVEAEPDAIVDLATLTGACVVALGREIAGVMGNNEGLVAQVQAASGRAGEPSWPLPLPERYRKHIDSEVADMKNIGAPGQAGALSAGLLLAEFVGQVPWAHLDIAGPARAEADDGYLVKGGTGFGVRTLIELLSSFEVPHVA